jgi:hypothetical protein
MIRFYAGTNDKAPTMEAWSQLEENRSVFLVADTGETYISDLEFKRLKCSPPTGTSYTTPNILDFGSNSFLKISSYNKYSSAETVTTQFTGDTIDYLGARNEGFTITTNGKSLNFITP